MSISSTARKAGPFFGNGVATDFSFDFKLFRTEELRVVRLDGPTGLEVDLVEGVDYDAGLNADQDENPGGGITLRAALASGDRVTLVSAVPELQPVDLTNQGGFYPDLLNGGLDRATILVQQLKEASDRSLKLPVSSTAAQLTLPLPKGDQLLTWNGDGSALVNRDPGELISVVTYGNTRADIFDGDGAQTSFVLSASPGSVNNMQIAINGVMQVPGIDYTWGGGAALSFTSAPPAGTKVFVRYQEALDEGTDVSGKADKTGGNLGVDDAKLFGETLGVYAIPVERFGAVADTLIVDNTDPINNAELAAAILGVSVTFREGAEYFFQGTLLARRSRLTWRGARARLTYCGADTTRNLLELGDGVNVYREQIIVGLEICSRTIMTGGWAVWAPKVVRSTHWFDNLQGQDFCEENVARGINPDFYGITLWGGYWADRVDNVKMFADAINAQHTGWKVNGAAGSPQADFWPVVGKVSWAEVGGHLAGGFGGLYLTPSTTLIHNKINLLVDQAAVAEPNRELFATGTIFDVAEGDDLDVHANIVIDDPGGVRINFTGCWFSAGQSHGIWAKRHGGVLTVTGGRIIQMVGDGFRTDQAGSGFTLISGMQITDCGGWGVSGRVNGHSIAVDGCQMFNNTLGDIDPNFSNTGVSESVAAYFLNLTAHAINVSGSAGVTAKYGFVTDAFHYITRFDKDVNGDGGDPGVSYDDGDYDKFIRSANRREWYTGSTRVGYLTGDGFLSLGGGPELQHKTIVTTTNGSGNVSVAHGLASGSNRILMAQVRVGADGAAKTTFNAAWDGTNIGVNGTGQNSTKAVVTMIFARNDT